MHRYLSPQIIKFVSALKYNPVKRIGKLGLYVFSGVAVTFLIMTFIAGPKALAAGNPLTISLVPPNYYSNYYYEISIDGTVTDTTPGATINPISWNWGDHTSSVSGWPAVHSYNNTLPNPPQTYPVTATVTDSNGQIASASEIGPTQPAVLRSPGR